MPHPNTRLLWDTQKILDELINPDVRSLLETNHVFMFSLFHNEEEHVSMISPCLQQNARSISCVALVNNEGDLLPGAQTDHDPGFLRGALQWAHFQWIDSYSWPLELPEYFERSGKWGAYLTLVAQNSALIVIEPNQVCDGTDKAIFLMRNPGSHHDRLHLLKTLQDEWNTLSTIAKEHFDLTENCLNHNLSAEDFL